MGVANVNGIDLEYDVVGEGAPLLLIMGLGTQRIFWHDDLVQYFVDRGFKVVRFDNRDIGASTHLDDLPVPTKRQMARALLGRRGAAPYLVDDMAADAVGLLDHLGIDRAHVVGASMGGMIAQALAVAAPERVASLTSIMSNTGDRRNGMVSPRLAPKVLPLMDRTPENAVDKAIAMWRALSGPHYEEAEIRRLVELAVARSDDRAGSARQLLAIVASPNRAARLRRLDLPALVIHGLDDRLVLPSGGIATARAIPGARLLMLPQMGHDLPRVYWDEMADAIARTAQRATAA